MIPTLILSTFELIAIVFWIFPVYARSQSDLLWYFAIPVGFIIIPIFAIVLAIRTGKFNSGNSNKYVVVFALLLLNFAIFFAYLMNSSLGI